MNRCKLYDLDGKIHKRIDKLQRQFLKMEKFMEENDLVLFPGKPLEYWVKRILELNHCPCNNDRLECPCSQAVEEIEKVGHCNCKLFLKRGFDVETR